MAVPALPAAIRLFLLPLPLFPLSMIFQQMVESVACRHPQLFLRLDIHAEKKFLIDPVDLPFVFYLSPRPNRPTLALQRREEGHWWDARISGPFGALIGMLHGSVDGDALFFSRDILIEGDTEAVLALRNALDDAEIDLVAEVAALLDPAAHIAERFVRSLVPVAGRLTGLVFAPTNR